MEFLETGVPTFVLLILAPIAGGIFAVWKLQMNVAKCLACGLVAASLAGFGFGLGEMISWQDSEVEIEQDFMENITINGQQVSTGQDVKITQYKQADPILTWSQAVSLLTASVGGLIIGFFWIIVEEEAVKKKTGRWVENEEG